MMPPSECPQATVVRGLPYWVPNVFSVLIWSGSAWAMAQPVEA